jgi:hypothetical protein
MKFTAKIKNGKILPIERVLYWDSMPEFEGRDVEITIERITNRSNPQNRYYWGVVVYMVRERLEELGYTRSDLLEDTMGAKLTRNDVHEFLKDSFNRSDIINTETGEILGSTSRTTSKLKTKEFSEYVDHIKRWAVESLDINIPDPAPFNYTTEALVENSK